MNGPHRTLLIVNQQRDRPIDRAAVRRVVSAVLDGAELDAELGFHFVTAHRSAQLNQRHLGHEGPTDILTFDHGSTPERLHGEMFICVSEAVRQANEWGTQWQAELLRYVIHGLLHLFGYDDSDPAHRRVMKREENRLVARWAQGSQRPRRPPTARRRSVSGGPPRPRRR